MFSRPDPTPEPTIGDQLRAFFSMRELDTEGVAAILENHELRRAVERLQKRLARAESATAQANAERREAESRVLVAENAAAEVRTKLARFGLKPRGDRGRFLKVAKNG